MHIDNCSESARCSTDAHRAGTIAIGRRKHKWGRWCLPVPLLQSQKWGAWDVGLRVPGERALSLIAPKQSLGCKRPPEDDIGCHLLLE